MFLSNILFSILFRNNNLLDMPVELSDRSKNWSLANRNTVAVRI